MRWPLQPLQPLKKPQLLPTFGPSVYSLCHLGLTTTILSYRSPVFETSATTLCGTTGTASLTTAVGYNHPLTLSPSFPASRPFAGTNRPCLLSLTHFQEKLQETHENLSLDGKNMQKPSKTIVFCQTQAINQNKIGQLWTMDRMTVTLSSDPQPANFAILHLPSLSSGSGRCLWSDPCIAGVAAESAELKKCTSRRLCFCARGGCLCCLVYGLYGLLSSIAYIYPLSGISFGQCWVVRSYNPSSIWLVRWEIMQAGLGLALLGFMLRTLGILTGIVWHQWCWNQGPTIAPTCPLPLHKVVPPVLSCFI